MISVLIVEDDAFIRDITTIKFSEHEYEVVACASAEAALEALEARAFDVLLLDLDLPDMSGIELLTAVRAHKNGTKIKVIVFSNSDDMELKRQITELGVLELFAKASTPYEELFRLIDTGSTSTL
jgi:CheY-like chemotaxis protein